MSRFYFPHPAGYAGGKSWRDRTGLSATIRFLEERAMLPNRLPLAAALMIAAGFYATNVMPSHASSFPLAPSTCHVGSCANNGGEPAGVAPEATLAGIELRATEVALPSATTTLLRSSLRPKACGTQVCLDPSTHFFNPRIAANGTHTTGIAAEAMRAVGPGDSAATPQGFPSIEVGVTGTDPRRSR